MSRIMVIAAHPDDEILGVGATIAKRVRNGDEAMALILGEGQTSRWIGRNETPKSIIESLHDDSMKAADIIGYQDVKFADFPDNRFDHEDLLDIVKTIEKYIEAYQPEIIYTHHKGDLNIDHQLTFQAVLTGTRPVRACPVKEIYAFETLSSSEWRFPYGSDSFAPNVFVNIEDYIDQKCAAMEQYQSELCQWPHPRSLTGLRVSAQHWGAVVGCNYAEAFELIRCIK